MHNDRMAGETGILKELPVKINRLLLGSTSPFRAQVLRSTGIHFDTVSSLAREEDIKAPTPKLLASLRAEHKARHLPKLDDACLVITADQVLDFKGKSYDKAASRLEAKVRLQAFAGAEHKLHSAYCLALVQPGVSASRILKTRVVSATLQMRELSELEIEKYLDTNEWQGCAGCYQFENQGVQLMARVDGDYSTIIGLPLLELLQDLRALGINGLLAAQGPWELTID